MSQYLYKIVVVAILYSVIACSSATSQLTLIRFSADKYEKIPIDKVQLYNNRAELPYKFVEIGTIKYSSGAIMEKVKQIAGDEGADAIIREGNNYILIKFIDKPKEKSDGKIS